jgi:hypothetical protein
MSNGTEYALMIQYSFISQQLTKYVGVFLYLLCLFGTAMNMLTFMRQTYHSRPCSLYLSAASLSDFIHLNLGPLSNILQFGFQYDWTINFIVFCKIKSYLAFVFGVMSATFTAIASIDRYVLSSKNPTRWKYSTRPVAIRCIQLTVLFWFIVSIPLVFCYTRFNHSSNNEQLICSNPSRNIICLLIQIVYVCFFNGFLPPLVMVLFGILTCSNVHHLRRRSLVKSTQIQKINYQLTSMLILQIVKSSFTSLPFSLFNCYLLITRNIRKSFLYQAKENLVHQIVYLLFWSNYTSFFVYIYSSDIFRKQWSKAIKRIVYYLCGQRRHGRYYQTELKPLTPMSNV